MLSKITAFKKGINHFPNQSFLIETADFPFLRNTVCNRLLYTPNQNPFVPQQPQVSKYILERGKNLEFLIRMVCMWFDVILSKVNEKLNRVLNNTAAENKWLLE